MAKFNNNKIGNNINYIFGILAILSVIIMPFGVNAEYSSYGSYGSYGSGNYFNSYNSGASSNTGYFGSYGGSSNNNQILNNQNNYAQPTDYFSNGASSNTGYFGSYGGSSNNNQILNNQNNYTPSTGYFSSYYSTLVSPSQGGPVSLSPDVPIIYSSNNPNSTNVSKNTPVNGYSGSWSRGNSPVSSYSSNLISTVEKTADVVLSDNSATGINNSALAINQNGDDSDKYSTSGFIPRGSISSIIRSPTRPDCGKYFLEELPFDLGYFCTRLATFPWLTAGQGWNSEVNVKASSESKNGIAFEVGLGSATSPSLVYGGISSMRVFDGFSTNILSGVSKTIKFLKAGKCDFTTNPSTCVSTEDLLTGTLIVRISAPDVATLEAVTTNIVYKHFLADKTLDWQVSAPVIYDDLGSSKWNINVAGISSNNSSFVVTNLSRQDQSVLVSVYDKENKLIASASTPVLFAGTRGFFGVETDPGGVYSTTLSNFFKGDIFSTSSGEPFQGTIRFEGSKGGNIGPLVMGSVVSANGSSSMSSFEAVPGTDTVD